MNSDMSQQVYQMLGNRQQPAITYDMLRDYAQQFGNNIQQNPYINYIMELYRNPQGYFDTQSIPNILITGDIRPNSSSAGNSL